MAKRRELKKAINKMCADLMIECLSVQGANKNIPIGDIENIAKSILLMQNDFVCRLSHVDKNQTKAFFHQLEDDLTASTNEIVDHIYHLI